MNAPRQRRADDAPGVDEDRVQRDGVDHAVGADELDGNDWRAGLSMARTRRAAARAPRPSRPMTPPAVSAHIASAGRAMQNLRDHEGAALGEAVRGVGRPNAPTSRIGRNWRGGGESGAPQPVSFRDQPGLGHRLHPVAGDGDHHPAEVAAVVRDGEGVEGAGEGTAVAPASSGASSRRSRIDGGAGEGVELLGGRSTERRAR